jgi:acetylornithine/N-succinyldiaminopimelate aminotransferase
MGPFLDNTLILEYNDISQLEKNINEDTTAVVLEFLQGEGGILQADPRFIEALFDLKKKYDFLVVADEIQSGIGRTGKYFAFQHYNVIPDIITLAKGMGGGLPLGAILVSEHLADIFEKGMHGTTYGGNAVACRAGKVVLDRLLNGLLTKVNENGAILKEKLLIAQSHFPDIIKEVRGLGLMLGLLLSKDAAPLVDKLLSNKVITNAASGNVLRLVPPLIVTENEIDRFFNALMNSLSDF